MPEADRVSRDPSPTSDGALSRCRRDYTVGASPSNPQEEIVAKILTPPQPAPVMEIARELLPPGMELIVADPGNPSSTTPAPTPRPTRARPAPASATKSSTPPPTPTPCQRPARA